METHIPTHPPAQAADINARLATLRKAWTKARGSERDYHLLAALTLCGPFQPLPDWLYRALRDQLSNRLPKEPNIHWARWLMVREGKERGISWKAAYKYASERLAGTPFAGSPSTIAKSYKLVQGDIRQRSGPTFRA
jgi:hypothetical protein